MTTGPVQRARMTGGSVMQGALLSYRALFTWLNPLGYISSRLIRPIGIAVVFTSLSSYYGAGIGRVLVGASLLAGAGAVIYGMALSVGNERAFGTLRIWLASPQNKLAAVCQRALPHMADGFVGGLCTYLVCCLLFGALPLPLPMFCGLLAISLVSAFGFSLALSAVALVVEDLFIGPNMAELILMMASGTLVPAKNLPGFLQPVSDILPLTHIMNVVARHLSGQRWNPSMLIGELIVAAGWFIVSASLVYGSVRRAMIRVSLD
jgi:ABC-2 type transport system permease protein